MKKWLKENIFVKDMFVYIVLGAIIFYIPAWGSLVLGYVFHNNYYYVFAGTYVALWAGPFTPTIPAIFAIAVAIKSLFKKRKKGSNEDETI